MFDMVQNFCDDFEWIFLLFLFFVFCFFIPFVLLIFVM